MRNLPLCVTFNFRNLHLCIEFICRSVCTTPKKSSKKSTLFRSILGSTIISSRIFITDPASIPILTRVTKSFESIRVPRTYSTRYISCSSSAVYIRSISTVTILVVTIPVVTILIVTIHIVAILIVAILIVAIPVVITNIFIVTNIIKRVIYDLFSFYTRTG